MAVYVDGLRRYPGGRRWCHLLADTEAELHAFAGRLGVKTGAERCQSGLLRYELTATERFKALVAGAKLLELSVIRRLLAGSSEVVT